MENENKEEIVRGYDLKTQNFRDQIEAVINNSELSPSTALYVLKDIVHEITIIYNQAVDLQYKKFCEEAKKQQEDNKKDEAE